ncbi:MAG: DUF1553 domain-containing protein, partial [Planctomycetes bacterium]|nr:DUF1553 domain-containing protein [Planctomycetota bacterium]
LYFACHPEGGGALKVLEFFDGPDPCDCYKRAQTLVPQQALALTNSEFTLVRSRLLAQRLLDGTAADQAEKTITIAFESVLTRRPSTVELTACQDFLKVQTELVGKTAKPEVARQRAWESLVRVLFSHHDFITLR